MDEFPFFYARNIDIVKNKPKKKEKSQIKNKSNKKEPLLALKHSNSDSDFIIKTEKDRRKIIRQYLRKKNKLQSIQYSKDTKFKSSPNKKGQNLKKIIKKNKNELSHYIQNNTQKVKLFGNPRYDKNSPTLFVEDFKNNLPEKKMGLIPLPSKKKKETDLLREPKNLFNMQRNISMVRRFQYQKKNDEKKLYYNKNNIIDSNNNKYFNMVQNWWKKIPKITDIQRVFIGYYVRKQVKPILKLYQFMKNFERFLVNLLLKDCLNRIKEYSALRRKQRINGNYISKIRKYIGIRLNNKIIMIENNFRCYKAKTKKNFLLRGKNGRIINKKSFFTKIIYVEQNKTNNNILKLQNNIKNYIESKNYYDRNLIHKYKGFYYYDKVFINKKNKKNVDFIKLLTHAVQLIAFKKKIYYKIPNNYDIDDINKVKYIQKNYLQYYYNKIEKLFFYNYKKSISYVDKIRKGTNIKEIEIIQKQIKNHLEDKKNYEKNIIRNKPISDNKIPHNNISNSLQSTINDTSYISKENILNVNNILIPAQKIIHKYIEKKNEKNFLRKNAKINKTGFTNNFFFTKEFSNKDKCFKRITDFQKLYNSQYKHIKDSIIPGDEDINGEYSSLEDYSIPKFMPLRKLLLKNKIPKKISFGLYISKTRYINYMNRYLVNYHKNDYLPYRIEGLFITKERYLNNEKEIKAIQKKFKKFNKNNNEVFCIQKPPTDNKNFYTFSSDSYDDIIYSKKLNNYYYLSKITKINIEEKVKKIQNVFLKHSNAKKNENIILNICKNLKNVQHGFYASKIRLGPSISENISQNKFNKKLIYTMPINNLNYITKIKYHNFEKDISFIQKNLRNKKIINKDEIIQRKQFCKNINKTNKNKNEKYNNINKKQKEQEQEQNISLGLYITKKYKRKIYKKEISKNSLIIKILKNPENMTQINIKFLLITSLFIKKNIQQYIFSLFKNNYENFEYPFYLDTINRVLKYLQSNEFKGKNVQNIFNKIFSDFNSNNTIKKDLILLLTKEKEDNLRNINIYNNLEKDFFDYLYQFSKFDKKLKNEKFLNVRLNNTIFNNTNIFTITKFIDNEFDNFVNGKYCYKCYLDLNLCKCFKSNDELTDEALDIGLNDDYNPKNSIKFFEYDNNNKTRGALIKGKPKIDNKDNIITKSHFNNNNINKKLKTSNIRNNNNASNQRNNIEFLRYYDNNKEEEDDKKDKIKLREN